MNTLPPKYITREELLERLEEEIPLLRSEDRSWWAVHRSSPFAVCYADTSHFVVAQSDEHIVFFADDEDEFGVARLAAADNTIVDYGLAGDLKDAVAIIRTIAV